jgi:hypothetical protein
MLMAALGLGALAGCGPTPQDTDTGEKIAYDLEQIQSPLEHTDVLKAERALEFLQSLDGERQVNSYWYVEQLPEGGEVQARYVMDEVYLRLDDGRDDADFALFDRKNGRLYSVNQASQTIMVIEPRVLALSKEVSELKLTIEALAQDDLPFLQGQQAQAFQTRLATGVCERVVALPGVFERDLGMFKAYRALLAEHQRAVIGITPETLRNPCVTSATTLNAMAQFSQGFPIRYERADGEARHLIDFRLAHTVSSSLFALPKSYQVFDLLTIPSFE